MINQFLRWVPSTVYFENESNGWQCTVSRFFRCDEAQSALRTFGGAEKFCSRVWSWYYGRWTEKHPSASVTLDPIRATFVWWWGKVILTRLKLILKKRIKKRGAWFSMRYGHCMVIISRACKCGRGKVKKCGDGKNRSLLRSFAIRAGSFYIKLMINIMAVNSRINQLSFSDAALMTVI